MEDFNGFSDFFGNGGCRENEDGSARLPHLLKAHFLRNRLLSKANCCRCDLGFSRRKAAMATGVVIPSSDEIPAANGLIDEAQKLGAQRSSEFRLAEQRSPVAPAEIDVEWV